MSSVQATDTQATSGAALPIRDRRRWDEAAGFTDLIAQFAQQTSIGAARNGSMSLQIGAPMRSRPGAHGMPSPAAATAPQGPSVRRGTEQRMGLAARAAKGGSQGGEHSVGPSKAAAGVEAERAPDSGIQAQDRDSSARREVGGQADADSRAQGRPHASSTATALGQGGQITGNSSGVVARLNAAGNASAQGNSGIGKASGAMPSVTSIGAAQALSRAQSRLSTARSSTPQSSPRESAAFRAQLAQGLGSALRQGRGEVTLKLRPHTLGELQVRLHIKNGAVDAVIRPSTAEAHRLLEQSVDALRHSFEARGLQPGRIEIQPPPEGKDAQHGGGQHADPQGQDGRAGTEEQRRSPEDPAGNRHSAAAGGGPSGAGEEETVAMLQGYGIPGIVYSVADGAARIVRIDALA